MAAEALTEAATEKEKNAEQPDENSKDKEKERKKKKRDKENPSEKSAEEKALEDRKREVEEELGEQLKERNREHEKHKLQEHEQNFKALIADLVYLFISLQIFNFQVKNTDMGWHDARKLLKKDNRYQNCDLLEKDHKERLFREHIRELGRKKRDVFFQVLLYALLINNLF